MYSTGTSPMPVDTETTAITQSRRTIGPIFWGDQSGPLVYFMPPEPDRFAWTDKIYVQYLVREVHVCKAT